MENCPSPIKSNMKLENTTERTVLKEVSNIEERQIQSPKVLSPGDVPTQSQEQTDPTDIHVDTIQDVEDHINSISNYLDNSIRLMEENGFCDNTKKPHISSKLNKTFDEITNTSVDSGQISNEQDAGNPISDVDAQNKSFVVKSLNEILYTNNLELKGSNSNDEAHNSSSGFEDEHSQLKSGVPKLSRKERMQDYHSIKHSTFSLDSLDDVKMDDHLIESPVKSDLPKLKKETFDDTINMLVVRDIKCTVGNESKLDGLDSQQNPTKNDNMIVLSPSNFDFLQSRGTQFIDSKEQRNSLLQIDPLHRKNSGRIVFSTPIASRKSNIFDLSVKITPIDELKGSGHYSVLNNSSEWSTKGAINVSGTCETNMDNETNSYVNSINIENTDDKLISVDGQLAEKKSKLEHTDEYIQNKMEEYEKTQELLLKRITEKDKAMAKISQVLELYEKAIAEVLAAKEKSAQTYEKTQEELRIDRDRNYQHLSSLESTFSDLHMKFERNKQYAEQLQEKLDALTEEKMNAEQLLKQQEARYDKMKNHTLAQFDVANAKLEELTKNYTVENTKLKTQIKREEIARNSTEELLLQKKKENEELVKICDELINEQRR